MPIKNLLDLELEISRHPSGPPAHKHTSFAIYIHPLIMYNSHHHPSQCTPSIPSTLTKTLSSHFHRIVNPSKRKKEKKKEPTNTKVNPPNQVFPSQPRINLLNNIPPRPSRPIATSLRNSRRQLDLLDFVRVRDRVDVQAAGHVPGYVAVESWDVC